MEVRTAKKFLAVTYRVWAVLAVLSFMVLYLSFIGSSMSTKGQDEKIIPLFIGQRTLSVYVADNVELREKGLSGMASLPEGSGMIFVFEETGVKGFWMKDMKFPIDIIWLDEAKRVVFVKNSALPSSYPEVFAPAVSARYVLETPAGFAEENRVKIGDMVSF